MSHLLFIFISRPGGSYAPYVSFVPQSLNRIEQRGFSRGVISEKNSHCHRKQRRHNHRLNGHLHRPLQRPASQERAGNSKENSRGTSDQAEHYRFSQELQLNRFLRGAHRDSHANLSSPLRYRNEHDVHDSNSTDDERNRSDSDQENGEGFTGFQLRLNDVFRIPDIEIIFFFRTQVMAV